MWQSIAQLWVSISLMLTTVNSATKTVHNLVSVAEAHSENFKQVSLNELQTKLAQSAAKAKAEQAALV